MLQSHLDDFVGEVAFLSLISLELYEDGRNDGIDDAPSSSPFEML